MNVAMSTDGLEALRVAMKNIEHIPDDVQDEMITAMADVRMEETKKTASSMLQGPYYTGDLAANVSHGKPIRIKDGRSIIIRWLGSQHGNRRSEIAYINEYGKKSQPARRFIKTAVKNSDETSMVAAGKIYDDWLIKNA